MNHIIPKLVNYLRNGKCFNLTKCRSLTLNQLEELGLERYRGLKRDFVNEVEHQFDLARERELRRRFTDPLLYNRASRKGRVLRKYISHAEFAGNYHDRNEGDMRVVSDYDGVRRMALVCVDSWVQYSSRYGTYRRCAGLVLYDEDAGEYRFLRVGPGIRTIDAALDYIKPAAVRKAERQGRHIKRQGDMYFVPQRIWNLSALQGTNHFTVERPDGGWDIEHPTHPTLHLRTPHKAHQQMIVQNRSFRHGGGRAGGHAD